MMLQHPENIILEAHEIGSFPSEEIQSIFFHRVLTDSTHFLISIPSRAPSFVTEAFDFPEQASSSRSLTQS